MASKEESAHIVDRREGETISVKARKSNVTKALNIKEGCDPPVIAVLGSGGGLRAMVGFLGTLSKLSELKLLDFVTYIGGTSGSTWCMSSLYANEDWTHCMQDLEEQICALIKSETKRDFTESGEKLKERFLGKMYSLTDFWAYRVVFKIINTMNKGKLSDHKGSCENGKTPYPIYSAVVKENKFKNNPGAWFEFTPHLSGFPAYNLYVKSEHLGSKFEGGYLREEQPENDLTYLQGMWGSAIGDTIPHLIQDALQELMSVLHEEVSEVCQACEKVKEILSADVEWIEGEIKHFWHKIFGGVEEALESTMGMNHCYAAAAEKLECPGTEPIMSTQDMNCHCELAKMIRNILYCICHWEWGTTNNFLYQWKNKIPEKSKISTKKEICLIDAGLVINTPFPLMLPPHRKVDLILSFDFSEGDPFLTLTQTADYCEKNKVTFPKMDLKDKDKDIPLKSCYMSYNKKHGNEEPIVMHFPLFNTENCGDKEKVRDMRKKYRTMDVFYDEAQLNDLLVLAKKNVMDNEGQILEKINSVLKPEGKKW